MLVSKQSCSIKYATISLQNLFSASRDSSLSIRETFLSRLAFRAVTANDPQSFQLSITTLPGVVRRSHEDAALPVAAVYDNLG